jgi:hypothetical protein
MDYQQGPTSAPGYQQTPTPQPGALPETQPATEPRTGLDKDEDEVFASVEDAQSALARAQAELDGLTLSAPARRRPATASAGASTPPAPKASEAPLTKADTRCESACKAFASLRRAADGVCRLTSESDARCTKARAIVKQSESRVAACGCQEPE